MANTINRLFSDSINEYSTRAAYSWRQGNSWAEISYRDVGERVSRIGAGLLSLGWAQGDRIAILANSRLEWSLFDFAALGAGLVVVPIYQTSAPDECSYIVSDSGARALVVENAEQWDRIAEVHGEFENLDRIILLDATGVKTDGKRIVALSDIESLATPELEQKWHETADSAKPDDLATFIYTSGTTGPPKGCMITHGNYAGLSDQVIDAGLGFIKEDIIILFLPLAHNFARLIQFVSFQVGGKMAYSSVPTVMEDMAEVKPTILPSVPRVFEKAHTRISGMFAEATGPKAKLIKWAMKQGALRGKHVQRGRSVPAVLAAQYALAHKLVFHKIHDRFGGSVRFCVSGGAPLSREVQEFFLACGLPILEGYGLTETTSALTVNRPNNFRGGSVGLALPRTEMKTADDGELLAKGPQIFRGYWNNEAATKEMFTSDGWLMTGDIGEIDRQGFVYITDRKKDIIVTAGGKNIAPQNVENALKAVQHISQALVYGDRKPYLAALLTLDPVEMEAFAKQHGLPNEMIELIASPKVMDLVGQAVEKVNSEHGRVEQIRRWRLLPIDFTVETGELTPTLKLKRKVVCERYASVIDEMYGDNAPDFSAVTDPEILRLQQELAAAV